MEDRESKISVCEPYVAEELIESRSPPVISSGFVFWFRSRFFSSIRSTILTLIGVYLAYQLLPPLINWLLLDAVWTGENREACKAISKDGACWNIISHRYDQLIYGFYPSELHWRPNLAFTGLLLALVPVMFRVGGRYRKYLLYYSYSFPVLVIWILWGGSFWLLPGFFLALSLSYGLYRFVRGFSVSFLEDGASRVFSLITSFVSFAVLWVWGRDFFVFYMENYLGSLDLVSVETHKFGGFLLTIIIGVTGIVASLPLGVLLALGRRSKMFFIKCISVGFIEFIRGVPLITLLFVASTLLNYFLPPGTSFDLILRVIIMVTLFASAYMAEVIRGGLSALPKGQYEAASALGLDYNQTIRFVIMPQALKISIPGIVNTFIGLFKDTTLVAIIGLLDPVGIMVPILSNLEWTGLAEELYIFIAIVFFVFCFGMSRYSMFLERRLDTSHGANKN